MPADQPKKALIFYGSQNQHFATTMVTYDLSIKLKLYHGFRDTLCGYCLECNIEMLIW